MKCSRNFHYKLFRVKMNLQKRKSKIVLVKLEFVYFLEKACCMCLVKRRGITN